MNSW